MAEHVTGTKKHTHGIWLAWCHGCGWESIGNLGHVLPACNAHERENGAGRWELRERKIDTESKMWDE